MFGTFPEAFTNTYLGLRRRKTRCSVRLDVKPTSQFLSAEAKNNPPTIRPVDVLPLKPEDTPLGSRYFALFARDWQINSNTPKVNYSFPSISVLELTLLIICLQ